MQSATLEKNVKTSIKHGASTRTPTKINVGITMPVLLAALASQTLDAKLTIDMTVRDGLTLEIAKALNSEGTINFDAMIEHNVIPRKTWESALKSGAKVLTSTNSERVLRVARVTGLAIETFGRDKADIWMTRPAAPLGGQAPMALLATESGARAVELLLGRINHGFAA